MLWASHPDEKLRELFRRLQGYVLIAHIAVMSDATTFDGWMMEEEEEDSKFYSSLYRPTWLVRRFTQEEDKWSEVLLSVMRASEVRTSADHKATLSSRLCYMDQGLRMVANTIDETVEPDSDKSKLFLVEERVNPIAHALRGIAGFLLRGLDPVHYVKRIRPNARGSNSGGGKTLGGAGDNDVIPPSEQWSAGNVKMIYGDPNDEHEPAVIVHLPVRWTRQTKVYARLIAAGDHPAEKLTSQRIQFAEDAAGATIAAGGAIEMANQLLPWAYQNLSTGELAAFMHGLQDLAAQNDPVAIELWALVSTMLWVGASFDQALSLYILLDETPDPDCDLALRTSNSVRDDNSSAAEWRVRALALPLKMETLPPAEKARERAYFFTLPDTSEGTVAVLNFLKYLRADAKEPLAQPEIMMLRPLRIFVRGPAWYRKSLGEISKKIDAVGRITVTRISRVLFQRVVEQTGGDVVSAALITNTDHSLASVRRFYDTPEIWHLQQTYANATTALKEELALAGYLQEGSKNVTLARRGISVGSPLCPTLRVMQDAICWLKDEVNMPFVLGNFIRKHNMYTLYSVWCFGFAVGARGVRTPYLHSSAIHQETGLATMTEKDNGTGYHSRLIWLPPFVREQIKRYERYVNSLSEQLKLPVATINRPCYFLNEKFKPVIVSPRTMDPLLSQFFPFPANVARHLISTELKERGFSPEMLCAWSSHWYRGQEPWGPYSSFLFLDYRLELERVLCPFLTEVLGFEPLMPQGAEWTI